MQFRKSSLLTIIGCPLLSFHANAALTFDGSDVSWIGSGSVVNANPDPGTYSGTPIVVPYVNSVNTGQLRINTFANSALNPTNRVSQTLSSTVDFSFTGGTGNLSISNSNQDDQGRGAELFNSFNLSQLSGVTSIRVTITYNEFLAGRSRVLGNILDFEGLSTLGAVGSTNYGSGLLGSDVNTVLTFGSAYGFNSATGEFEAGLPSNGAQVINALTAAGGGLPTPPTVNGTDVVFDSPGLSGLIDSPGGLDRDFLFLRAFDSDGTAGLSSGDAENFYAKSLTFEITPETGKTFEADTSFTFSLDGQQHSNLAAVPEPSSLLILGLAGMSGLMVRRRR